MSNGTTAAIVGEDAQLTGRFGGQDLDVLGRLEGDVEVKGRLRIGKKGRVNAKVKAAVVEIEGEFEGEVRADALTLTETAKARGTFIAKRLNVREGAVLEGAINPASAAPAATPSAPAPAPPVVPTPGPTPAVEAGSAAPTVAPAESKPEDGGKTP
jgi:cytoskeletal protein CcmA (bactofilin family)